MSDEIDDDDDFLDGSCPECGAAVDEECEPDCPSHEEEYDE